MPNWCSNHGFIKLPTNASPEAVAAFRALSKVEDDKDEWFAKVLPCPPEADWYEWRIRRYGTKWDVTPSLAVTDDQINFSFESAWAPPLEFFKHLAETYGLHYQIQYSEPGCCFGGTASYDGDFQDKYVENEEYLVAAVDEFGEPIESVLCVESYESFDAFCKAHKIDSPRLKDLVRDYYRDHN
jgi:hypothetical protein